MRDITHGKVVSMTQFTRERVPSAELFGIDTSEAVPTLDFLPKKEFSSSEAFFRELSISLKADKICTMTGSGTDKDPFVLDFPYSGGSQENYVSYREARETGYQKFKDAVIQGMRKLHQEGKTVPKDISVIQKITRIPDGKLNISPIQTENSEIIQISE